MFWLWFKVFFCLYIHIYLTNMYLDNHDLYLILWLWFYDNRAKNLLYSVLMYMINVCQILILKKEFRYIEKIKRFFHYIPGLHKCTRIIMYYVDLHFKFMVMNLSRTVWSYIYAIYSAKGHVPWGKILNFNYANLCLVKPIK